MTVRTRLTAWYAAVMFASLLAIGLLVYREFAPEPKKDTPQEIAEDASDFQEVLRILLWCGVPAALLAVGGGWWLTQKSLAPVERLTAAAEKINAGNLGERLARSGNGDEFDRLTAVFNAMLGRLDDSFSRIREFTLHASHELKTPLTVMQGEVETALREADLPTAERERLLSQLDEIQRLAKIVDGLSLLTKADAGQVKLDLQPEPLDELVRDNFADAQILAESQGIRVELAACEPIAIRGDRHRLRQLLLNLADNAVKYNHRQGHITMGLRRAGEAAEFRIENTGPGIVAEALPQVFDRFFRGDPAHATAIDGCGLGLSIAKWIVSAHHGDIRIESMPGKLTTVIVRLPVSSK